jgi:hypothetical protein
MSPQEEGSNYYQSSKQQQGRKWLMAAAARSLFRSQGWIKTNDGTYLFRGDAENSLDDRDGTSLLTPKNDETIMYNCENLVSIIPSTGQTVLIQQGQAHIPIINILIRRCSK